MTALVEQGHSLLNISNVVFRGSGPQTMRISSYRGGLLVAEGEDAFTVYGASGGGC